MPWEFEREHYRIVYPTAARPWLDGGGAEHEVIDLCEAGLRYRLAPAEERLLGDQVEGVVHFRRGEEVRVVGTVVRIADRQVSLKLSLGVPLRVVLDEQRYLRDHHRGSDW